MEYQQKACSTAVKDQFFKIKLCPYHTRGLCKKGKRCSFAHSHDELRVGVTLRKTKLCDPWKRGECSDHQCPFAHGEEELRSTPDYYKTALCRFWMKTTCPQGDSCRHAHGDHELRSRSHRPHPQSNDTYLRGNLLPSSSIHHNPSKASLGISDRKPVSCISPPPGFQDKDDELIEVYDGLIGARVLVRADASKAASVEFQSPDRCAQDDRTDAARLRFHAHDRTPATTAPSSPLVDISSDASTMAEDRKWLIFTEPIYPPEYGIGVDLSGITVPGFPGGYSAPKLCSDYAATFSPSNMDLEWAENYGLRFPLCGAAKTIGNGTSNYCSPVTPSNSSYYGFPDVERLLLSGGITGINASFD